VIGRKLASTAVILKVQIMAFLNGIRDQASLRGPAVWNCSKSQRRKQICQFRFRGSENLEKAGWNMTVDTNDRPGKHLNMNISTCVDAIFEVDLSASAGSVAERLDYRRIALSSLGISRR
jgi:hypothetical protein